MPNWAHSLFVCLLLAGPAAATPERSVQVRDSLFARTADHVFILRDLIDNEGSYYVSQTDTVLLTVSIRDGSVVAVDPVARARETFLDGDADNNGTVFTTLKDAVNPYDVRAMQGAAPLIDPVDQSLYRRALILPTGLMVFEGEALRQYITFSALRAQLDASVLATRTALPPAFAPDGEDILLDLFDPRFESDCRADRTHIPLFAEDSAPALVRMNCSDQGDGAQGVYWVVVPALN